MQLLIKLISLVPSHLLNNWTSPLSPRQQKRALKQKIHRSFMAPKAPKVKPWKLETFPNLLTSPTTPQKPRVMIKPWMKFNKKAQWLT